MKPRRKGTRNWSKEYYEKLKDPRWQKKRLEIFERDGWQCSVCKSTEKELHVHHARYSTDPWSGQPEDYYTVCGGCHDWMYWATFVARKVNPGAAINPRVLLSNMHNSYDQVHALPKGHNMRNMFSFMSIICENIKKL